VSGNLRRLLAVRMLYWTHFVAAVLVPFLTDWGGLTLLQVFVLNACHVLERRPTSPGAVLAGLVIAMGLGHTRTPVAAAAVNETIGSAERATTLSTVSMLRTLAVCIVNPVAGLLADRSLGLAVGTLGVVTVLVGCLSPLRERHLTS
jgi:hypothetical protein